MKTNGQDQRDCADCGNPIDNAPRVTIIGFRPSEQTRVVCQPCYNKLDPPVEQTAPPAFPNRGTGH